MLSWALMMMSLETLKISFALDIKLSEESVSRDIGTEGAAKRFFHKMLKATSHPSPRVINVDKNQAYPPAVEQLKEEGPPQPHSTATV